MKTLLKAILPQRLTRIGGEMIYRYKHMVGSLPYSDFVDYDAYWERRKTIGHILNRWSLASNEITEGSSVVDIGCGSGEFLEYLSQTHENLELSGTDFSQQSVNVTSQLGFSAVQLDISTNEPEGTYDYATCFEVLEHIPEAERALQNIKSHFRKQLIFSIPNIGYIGCRIRLAIFGRFPITMCVYHVKEHVRHWTPRDIKEWMELESLQVVRIEGQYGPSYLPWKKFPGLFANGLLYFIEHRK